MGLNSILKVSNESANTISNSVDGRKLSSNLRSNTMTKLIGERASMQNNRVNAVRRQRSLDKFPSRLERIVEIKSEKITVPMRQLSVREKLSIKPTTESHLKDSPEAYAPFTIVQHSASTSRSSSSSPSLLSIAHDTDTLQPVGKTTNLSRSFSIDAKTIERRKPIMKSDFTNTVLMRKHSLEMNALKEKSMARPKVGVVTSSGVVSMLKQRFSSESIGPTTDISHQAAVSRHSRTSCMDQSVLKSCAPNANSNNNSMRYSNGKDNNINKFNLVRSKSNTDTTTPTTTTKVTGTNYGATAVGSNRSTNNKTIRLSDIV